MDLEKDLEEIKKDISENQLAPVKKESTGALGLIETAQTEILKSDEAKQAAGKIGFEKISSDFRSEAAKINEKNIATAEREFETETRKRRLERLNREMDLQHKYNMSMIDKNGKHLQMLDNKKKLVEKYGYLYDWKDPVKAKDSDGNEYDVPRDFSYSEFVNKIRQFGRNVSKLDKPVLQTLKWFLIIGGLVVGYFILRHFGIMR